MAGTVNEITINGQDRYVTQMMGVATWEVRMIRRLRQLLGRGDGDFLIRKQGDIILIHRICEPEIVKGEQ